MSSELGLVGPDAVDRFLACVYRTAPSASVVVVRFRVDSGMGQCFGSVAALDRAAETILALASRTDVYVGVLPRRRCSGGRRDLVDRADVVWVDCDSAESTAALREFRPRPMMAVASGSGENRHAYWQLRERVELDVIERVNRRLALTLGGDLRCSDAARILRPAGSVNRKHSPPSPVRLLHRSAADPVRVEDLEHALVVDPRAPERPRQPRRRRAGDGLAGVPPREYFERLTGLRVGRTGKLCCPFHDDLAPSLHVYEEPGRGWYCFGCGRGGSIYDLAALVWRRGTRGLEFVELRRDLRALWPDLAQENPQTLDSR